MINKLVKKVSVLMVLVLMTTVFTGTIPASAQEIDSTLCLHIGDLDTDAEIVPMGALCGNCNIGTIVTTYGAWGDWYTVEEVKCTHYYRGTDVIQKRTRVVTSKCNYCGSGSSRTGSSTRTVCHGYNQ